MNVDIKKDELVYVSHESLIYDNMLYEFRAVYHGLELWRKDNDGFLIVHILKAVIRNMTLVGFNIECSCNGRSFVHGYKNYLEV